MTSTILALLILGGSATATPTPIINIGGSGGSGVLIDHDGNVKLTGKDGGIVNVDPGNTGTVDGNLITVSQGGQKTSYDCKGGSIAISSADNHLQISNCAKVMVSGADNEITLEKCGALSVSGAHNTIASGSASAIAVSGTHNHVTYSKDAKPSISNTGKSNSIAP